GFSASFDITVCDATPVTPALASRATIAFSTASRPPGSTFIRLMTKILLIGPAVYLGSFHVPWTSVLSESPPGLHSRVLPHAQSASAAMTQIAIRMAAILLQLPLNCFGNACQQRKYSGCSCADSSA